MKHLCLILTLSILAGCVSKSSVPDGYKGEVATIDDTFMRAGRGSAKLFYVRSIDGIQLVNALNESVKASSGKGLELIAMGASRSVQTESISLHLVGEVYHSAGIGYMLNVGSNYRVEGDVTFIPKPSERYVVRGSLGEKRSAVWLEDINGNVVSDVLEMKGSSPVVTRKPGADEVGKILDGKSKFLQLTGGESVEFVEYVFGKPDYVGKYRGNMLIGRYPSVTYRYKELGSITFSTRQSKPFHVTLIEPAIDAATGDTSNQALRLSEGVALQKVAKAYYLRVGLDTETLDAIADRIWEDKDTDDNYTVDGLSWLCKVIGKSGNPRYRYLLETVSTEASSKKLQRYASVALETLLSESVEQYKPGSDESPAMVDKNEI